MNRRRTSPVRRLPVAPGKIHPPWCWIHERRLVYKHGLWVCPEVDRLGIRCDIACTDEHARERADEIL